MSAITAPPMTGSQRSVGQAIINALDQSPFTKRHAIFTAAILASLFFDYGKPIALSFVIPGMRETFGLTPVQGSLLPLFGLTGTTIGAIFWGWMSDRVGRRVTLLWTVAIFSVASLCGLTQAYWQSLLACLIMGFGVGAEVPAVLAAEYIPARYRARALLFLGIIGWLGGYAITASLSALFNTFLDPTYAWRLIWLVNIIPGVLIVVMRRRILPESARFLLHKGKVDEALLAAESIVGPIKVDHLLNGPAEDAGGKATDATGMSLSVPHSRLHWRAVLLGLFSLLVGFANFGFVIWLPTILQNLQIETTVASANLAASSLIAIPALILTIPILHRLGTRRTLITYALGAGIAMFFLGLGTGRGNVSTFFLIAVVSAIFFFMTSIGGVLSLYGVEIFPTGLRARLSGLVAALGRVGALSGPFTVSIWIQRSGAISVLEIALAVILVLAAVFLVTLRVETHGRTLEQI